MALASNSTCRDTAMLLEIKELYRIQFDFIINRETPFTYPFSYNILKKGNGYKMLIMSYYKLRDEKLAQLRNGHTAYAKSRELIRILKRGIEKEQLRVHYDETQKGCWIIPLIPEKYNYT